VIQNLFRCSMYNFSTGFYDGKYNSITIWGNYIV